MPRTIVGASLEEVLLTAGEHVEGRFDGGEIGFEVAVDGALATSEKSPSVQAESRERGRTRWRDREGTAKLAEDAVAAWLADIRDAGYLLRGSVFEGIVRDAYRTRLMEIGEAVKNLDPALLATAPGVRWREIAGMRDQLAHHYFGTDHAIVG